MAAGTSAVLLSGKKVKGEISAQHADTTGHVYLGTSLGEVLKYTISGGALAKIGSVGKAITSLSIYSGLLYIGHKGGRFSSMTTS